MNISRPFCAILCGLTALVTTKLALPTARAQTAVTDPVGYLTIPLLANSDTFISLPFTRPIEFTGAIASVSGNTITFAGAPGFTAGGYAPLGTVAPNDGHKTYYAIIGPKNVALTPTLSATNGSTAVTASAALPPDFLSGDTVTLAGYTFTVAAVSGTTLTIDRAFPGTTAAGLAATYNHSPSEGRFYTITANDVGTLTVNLNGDSLGNITAGTQANVISYWTLGTAFPAADAGKSFFASNTTFNRATELMFPDQVGLGTNKVPAATYYFYNSAWRKIGNTASVSSNDELVYPDIHIISRNNTAAAGAFTPLGNVVVNRISTPLVTQASGKQDDPLSIARPVAMSLNDSGLISSGAFKTSTSTFDRADELYVYDNTASGQRKVPSATYYYYNNGWRKIGVPISQDFGSDLAFQPGAGFVIRKGVLTGETVFWINAANYLR